MSVMEQVSVQPFSFDQAVIDGVCQEVRNADFRVTMLAPFKELAPAVYDLHETTITSRLQKIDPEQISFATNAQLIGMLAAFAILQRSQTEQSRMGEIDPKMVRCYAERIRKEPKALREDFYRNYGEHSEITDFVENTLTNEFSKYGAMLMFAIVGGMVNPRRLFVCNLATRSDSIGGRGYTMGHGMPATTRPGRRASKATGLPITI